MTATVEINSRIFEQALQEHLNDKCQEIAKQIRDDAKRTVEFKDITGRLRKSLKVKKSKYFEEGGGYIVKAGGKGAMQAWLVEHGHGGPRPAPPHPYLKPALDKNINMARQLFNEGMK